MDVKKHMFVAITTFHRPMWCMYCSKSIYGLVHQGYECRACEYRCHKKCMTKVKNTCGDPLPKSRDCDDNLPGNFVSLTKLVTNAALQGISVEQKLDMFISAVQNKDKAMAQYMIEKYVETSSDDINMQDRLGNTALHYMAMGDFESDMIAHAMRSSCIESDIPNNDGNSPLHYLCQKFPTVDCVDIGEMLIQKGANVNRQNVNGETPLHKAVFNKNVRFLLFDLLLKHGADPNLVNKSGETPLHYAVRLNREDLVKFLLKEGAFSDIEEFREKKTALQLAEEEDNEDIIKILKRGHEVTTFLRDLHLEVYTKQFLKWEMRQEGVLSYIDNTFLDSIGITNQVHRAVLLQNRSTRRPRLNTQAGKELQACIVSKSLIENVSLTSDNWIIQNEEIEFLKKLGNGTSGTVYKGLFLGTEVAVKVLKKSYAKHIDDFIKEFTTMCKVRTPGTLALFGAVLEPKVCLVMELAEKGSLYDVLQSDTVDMDWERVIDFASQAASGMKNLHELEPPLLHRDFKTLNLMVTGTLQVKVGDFGLSSFAEKTQDDAAGPTGTIAYMAPEVFEGLAYTTKADVYSYGVVLWELVNKLYKGVYEKPFSEFPFHMDIQVLFAAASQQLRPTIPEKCCDEMKKLIQRCWDPSPDNRPAFKEIYTELTTVS